jgi:hypothetical protein
MINEKYRAIQRSLGNCNNKCMKWKVIQKYLRTHTPEGNTRLCVCVRSTLFCMTLTTTLLRQVVPCCKSIVGSVSVFTGYNKIWIIQYTGKDMQGSGCGPIEITIPVFACRNWRKARKTSFRLASLRAEIWIRDLPNMKRRSANPLATRRLTIKKGNPFIRKLTYPQAVYHTSISIQSVYHLQPRLTSDFMFSD